jgi:hypothetical protein
MISRIIGIRKTPFLASFFLRRKNRCSYLIVLKNPFILRAG